MAHASIMRLDTFLPSTSRRSLMLRFDNLHVLKKIVLNAWCLLWSLAISAQSNTGYLTEDGTWCWFSDPRAIYFDGNVITGWVKANGTVEAVIFNVEDKSIHTDELYYRLEKDDHNNPAFVKTADDKILVMYTRHGLKDLFINVLDCTQKEFDFQGAQLIHPISKDELEKYPRETITYANPFRIKEENNRIYCFGRWTGFKPNIIWTDDNGVTWTESKVFITSRPFDPNNRPYVKYFSDGKSRIHIAFTDGHPHVEPLNSVYYTCFEKGGFFKSDGSKISDLENIPFVPGDASIIYQANEENGRAWIADIGQDEHGNPVVLYTKSPEATDHRYWYARFDGKEWINHEICKSGKWFPQTPDGQQERELYYFGGMTIHPGNADVVYLSRQINDVFEIERWETTDSGKTWSTEAITQNSTYDNVRPFVPRGLSVDDHEIVLWMENQKYIHYTDYQTSIRYQVRKK